MAADVSPLPILADADEHVRRIMAIHFDPESGAPFWLERQADLGIDVRAVIGGVADLVRLGPMDENALRDRSLLDFVPRSQRHRLAGAVIGETGGTTGPPKRTIFTREEFHRGFVEPFVLAADHVGFPRGAMWLWLGPSGPHVIGQAAAACAAALGSPQPLSVDFDPRWFRKLPPDSVGRQRYLDHVLEQAQSALEKEPIGVVFTTPTVLERLSTAMTPVQRARIRGVHYGGTRVDPALLRAAQEEWFPSAVHLAGYGNSLFGVCMEFGRQADRPLRYYPFSPRHLVQVAADGRVRMSRLDPTVLIANLWERDAAKPCGMPPADAPAGFGMGVEDPHPVQGLHTASADGIY